jgi:PadR family transcriptional regulator
MSTRDADRRDLLQGTLDLLILQTLGLGAAHGHAIMHAIQQGSDEVLRVEQGSLYPALHQLIKLASIVLRRTIGEGDPQ